MELLAAFAEHAAASDCRMGPPAVRWRRHTSRAAARGPGEHSGAGQARSGRECSLARAAPRHSGAAGTRASFGARGITPPATCGTYQLGDGRRTNSAGGACGRRSALGRSDNTRCLARHRRTRCAGALVRSRRLPGRSFGPPGARALITARFRWCHSTVIRFDTWSRNLPPGTRWRRK